MAGAVSPAVLLLCRPLAKISNSRSFSGPVPVLARLCYLSGAMGRPEKALGMRPVIARGGTPPIRQNGSKNVAGRSTPEAKLPSVEPLPVENVVAEANWRTDPALAARVEETLSCLTLKRRRFLLNYLENGNARHSVMAAGYNCKSPQSATDVAKKLMADPSSSTPIRRSWKPAASAARSSMRSTRFTSRATVAPTAATATARCVPSPWPASTSLPGRRGADQLAGVGARSSVRWAINFWLR